MRAGSVGEEGGEVVCRVHNGVTVEEHRWAAVLDSEPLVSSGVLDYRFELYTLERSSRLYR